MTEKSLVNHVTQTGPFNCVSACIAMVSNKDIDLVTKEFHDAYRSNKLEVYDYLTALGVPFTRLLADDRYVKPDMVYLACVPSLNIVGGQHYIVIEVDKTGKSWLIHDPNNGRENVKYYLSGSISDSDKQVSISAYDLHYAIPRSYLRQAAKEQQNES